MGKQYRKSPAPNEFKKRKIYVKNPKTKKLILVGGPTFINLKKQGIKRFGKRFTEEELDSLIRTNTRSKTNTRKKNEINIIVNTKCNKKSCMLKRKRKRKKRVKIPTDRTGNIRPTKILKLNYYRPVPPENPRLYKYGTIRKGNDGKLYINIQSRTTKKWIWIPYKKN